MARVYVSVGSNIEPARNIHRALGLLRRDYPQLSCSPMYESEAVGFEGDNFYNFVLTFNTEATPPEIARLLREIEDTCGRDRTQPRFSKRTIDLDLLLYDNLIVNEAGLNLPREEIPHNAFVLLPLAELAPELTHPQLGKTMAQLWQAYDKESQQLWQIDFDYNAPAHETDCGTPS